jgi:hypothetical protein
MRGGLPGRTRIRQVDVDPPSADPPLMATTPTSTSSASGMAISRKPSATGWLFRQRRLLPNRKATEK